MVLKTTLSNSIFIVVCQEDIFFKVLNVPVGTLLYRHELVTYTVSKIGTQSRHSVEWNYDWSRYLSDKVVSPFFLIIQCSSSINVHTVNILSILITENLEQTLKSYLFYTYVFLKHFSTECHLKVLCKFWVN